MSSVVISGDTSGAVTVSAPAVAGTNTATLPAATGELSMLGGTGQTWQIVTGSRVSGTTYTNSTGKPIFVAVDYASSAAFGTIQANVGGVTFYGSGANVSGIGCFVSFIVPNGVTYVVTMTDGSTSFGSWAELR